MDVSCKCGVKILIQPKMELNVPFIRDECHHCVQFVDHSIRLVDYYYYILCRGTVCVGARSYNIVFGGRSAHWDSDRWNFAAVS